MFTSFMTPNYGDWVELSARKRSVTGKLFEKHILNMGKLRHPKTGATIDIDRKFVDTMISNFNNGVCDIVQVPLANKNNEHSEDPRDNIGEVVSLSERDGKVYAIVDVRDEAAAEKLGKTFLGASAYFNTNYKDTDTGDHKGPTLLHLCVTNRPYVTGLEDYKELVAASADTDGEAVLLTDYMDHAEGQMPTKEELIKLLKDEHNIDVPALQGEVTKLSNSLTEALGDVKLSNGNTVSLSDAVGAVRELAGKHKALEETNVKLSSAVVELSKRDAEREVKQKVSEGYISPKQEPVMTELYLSNRTQYEALLPEKPIYDVSGKERGFDSDDVGLTNVEDVTKEAERLAALTKNALK